MNGVLKLAVTAAALSNDPSRAAETARRMNLQGLLFDAFSPTIKLPELSQSGRREFLHLVRHQDREIAGLRIDLGQNGLSPKADVDQQLSRIEQAMNAAKELAAPLVCVDLGPLPAPNRATPAKPKVTPDMAGLILLPTIEVPAPTAPEDAQTPADLAFITHLDPVMYELGQRADRIGVMLAFRSELASLAALERTVLAARCPWFGFDLDPVALLRDGEDLDAVFSRIGQMVNHVRARDAIQGSGHRTRATVVGSGAVKWDHLMANLNGAGYQGWLTLDPADLSDRISGTAEGATFLRAQAIR
jgi:sugar phosphate isomerase/epimerase